MSMGFVFIACDSLSERERETEIEREMRLSFS